MGVPGAVMDNLGSKTDIVGKDFSPPGQDQRGSASGVVHRDHPRQDHARRRHDNIDQDYPPSDRKLPPGLVWEVEQNLEKISNFVPVLEQGEIDTGDIIDAISQVTKAVDQGRREQVHQEKNVSKLMEYIERLMEIQNGEEFGEAARGISEQIEQHFNRPEMKRPNGSDRVPAGGGRLREFKRAPGPSLAPEIHQ